MRKTGVTAMLVVASFLAARLCFWLLPDVFEPWNAQTVDQFFQLRSALPATRPAYDDTIVHIDITNTTIQMLNNYYLNRSHFAQVIRNLGKMGTAAQIYDMIFAARTNEKEDRALIEATAEAGNVYLGMAFLLGERELGMHEQPSDPQVIEYLRATCWPVHANAPAQGMYAGTRPFITFYDLAKVARGLGYISVKSDADGVFRRAPLLVRFNGAFYPSFPFRTVCDYLGMTPDRILLEPGRGIILKGACRPGGQPHDIEIPIDERGNLIINFIGPWEAMDHFNFAEVYRASEDRDELDMWREQLTGRIVLISDVSTGSPDLGPVPMDVNFPLSALHASVIHTILTGKFLTETTGIGMFLIEVMVMLMVLGFSLRFSSVLFSIGTIGLALSYLGAAVLAFIYGQVILHVMRPLFSIGFALIGVTAYRYFSEEKEKEVLRKTFEAYFPPSVVRKIMANPDLIASNVQKKELTILFSDIKSFTAHSATMAPDQIRRYLNEYFEAMVEIVFAFQGTVDKYIGDGLMVFFGDPEVQPDHAVKCVGAAIEMQKKARQLRAEWEKGGGLPLQIRIGINTGEVVVGNMGSQRHFSYTVLGSAVNLAQRLESGAPVGGIMVSPRTHELIKDHFRTRSLGEMVFKGLDRPLAVHEVLLDQGANPHEN